MINGFLYEKKMKDNKLLEIEDNKRNKYARNLKLKNKKIIKNFYHNIKDFILSVNKNQTKLTTESSSNNPKIADIKQSYIKKVKQNNNNETKEIIENYKILTNYNTIDNNDLSIHKKNKILNEIKKLGINNNHNTTSTTFNLNKKIVLNNKNKLLILNNDNKKVKQKYFKSILTYLDLNINNITKHNIDQNEAKSNKINNLNFDKNYIIRTLRNYNIINKK